MSANYFLHLTIDAIFIYFIAMHGTYFVLIVLGALAQKRYHRSIQFGDLQRVHDSPLSLPISIVIAAYNEEKMIIQTVENVLRLNYPEYEIIVVNDGSQDKTLALLIEHFNMVEVSAIHKNSLETTAIKAVYRSSTYPNLKLVDKENGRRADANNAGVEYSRYPIICEIDADCVLEQDALLRMISPFLYDPSVVAATGMIRPSNGLVVTHDGVIMSRGLPSNWLATFQYVEYLRSFQWARSGLTMLNSNLCMSGAYTLVRRDIFLKVGGANTKAVVDDFELTVTIHRYIYEHPEEGPMRIAYVPDPGNYSEVPDTVKAFMSQRNFWQRAILQSLIWNRDMALNHKFGAVGFFGFPFFFLFEAFSAVVEAIAYLFIPTAILFKLVGWQELALFFIFGICLGAFVSVSAVLLQESTRLRQQRTRDVVRLISAGFLEHFGFHQMHVLARLIGIYDLLVRGKIAYGYRVRTGYTTHQSGG